ncbi:MAG: polysaccharide biosynthesis/export family protein [Verrucomicrobiota bacterium]
MGGPLRRVGRLAGRPPGPDHPARRHSHAGKTARRGGSQAGGHQPPRPTAYRIRGGDLLELKVYQEEDLNSRVRVEADGAVVLPLVGRLTVRNLTVEEAQRLVHDRLEAEFLNNPQVTLTVTEFSPQRYSVMGQVARPGVYQIPPGERVTLLQAIATAGSYTRIASPSNVKVKRRGPNGMEVIPVNAKAMASDPTRVFFIETDDEVLVGESAL